MAGAAAGSIGMALAGASAYMQLKGAQAQAKGLAAQAGYTRMQAKQESIKYKQQAVQVLDNILATSAETVARAGAGGIDPFSNTAGDLQNLAMAKGAMELYTVQDNELLALRGGEMQANQFMLQAKAAKQAGFASAIGTLGQGYMMKASIG